MLDSKYKDKTKSVDIRYRRAGLIPRYSIRQALKNNVKLAEFEVNSYGKLRSGADVVLDNMIENGYLYKVEK
jgi:hypothetical protein